MMRATWVVAQRCALNYQCSRSESSEGALPGGTASESMNANWVVVRRCARGCQRRRCACPGDARRDGERGYEC